jgi:hypothetical protein
MMPQREPRPPCAKLPDLLRSPLFNTRNTLNNSCFLLFVFSLICLPATQVLAAEPDWKPAPLPLETRWTREVRPDNVWPEYPRPQLVRADWKNLNGLWQYQIQQRDLPRPAQFSRRILVPFAVDSALSGVGKRLKPDDRIWYRRNIDVPSEWRTGRIMLHFGAVDWDAYVYVNGKEVVHHRGGYDPFSVDITDALKPSDVHQELVVSAWDPSDTGYQPRGKQVLKPEGVWYTGSGGIWQTVWLEPVPDAHISRLKVVPHVDSDSVSVTVVASEGDDQRIVNVVVRDGDKIVSSKQGAANSELRLPIPDPKLWSPSAPHLYDLQVSLNGEDGVVDEVESYFGMRKVSLGKDKAGRTRICLNGQPQFQMGLLDQGFWPDGLYTPPTDEAMKFDLEATQKLGFNLIRKHVKVEPLRWYTYCDRMGILVWQDMPNGDRFLNVFKPVPDADLQRSAASAAQYELELRRMIEALHNHPSVIMWIPFNEGWGQFETGRITQFVRELDPSRIVDSASGLVDRGTGDVNDLHNYLGLTVPPPEPTRAVVLGEFGGLGLHMAGHMWDENKKFEYRHLTDSKALTDAYVDLMESVRVMQGRGMSAAVYTQTTDVEIEINGQLTYDRRKFKMDVDRVATANRTLYEKVAVIKTLVPTSELDGQGWRYVTHRPADEWVQHGFSDGAWNRGKGVFGNYRQYTELVRTEWSSPEIWSFQATRGWPSPSTTRAGATVIHGNVVSPIPGLVSGPSKRQA